MVSSTRRALPLLAGQPPWAVNRLGDVGNAPTAPESDLVAEDPKPPCPATADGALGDDAPLLTAPVVDRRLLDDEPVPSDFDPQRGVIEVARRTPLQPCRSAPRRHAR